MNKKLVANFTIEEVKAALKHMAPLKALVLDGMLPYSTKTIGRCLVLMYQTLFYII